MTTQKKMEEMAKRFGAHSLRLSQIADRSYISDADRDALEAAVELLDNAEEDATLAARKLAVGTQRENAADLRIAVAKIERGEADVVMWPLTADDMSQLDVIGAQAQEDDGDF